MIVILGYVVALLALICGGVCIKGTVAPAKLFGAIFAVLGLAALRVSIYSIASQIEEEN